MLDVRRLRVLCEVARAGSLAGAAEALNYSPSAVSQQIATLEREVGMALVERRSRGIIVTEAGRTLVEHAEAVFARLEAAEEALAEIASGRGGLLRMAAFPTVAGTVLPKAAAAFRTAHPGVRLKVTEASPAKAVTLVRDGRLDLALTLDLPASERGVEVFDLFDDPVQLAVPADHVLAGVGEARLADLADETWVDVPPSNSDANLLVRACARAGFDPNVAFESDDYEVIRELVATGVGIALLPDLARRPPDDRVVLVSLGPSAPSRAIQAAARPESIRTAAASAMLDILRAQRHPHPPSLPASVSAAEVTAESAGAPLAQAAGIASPPSR
jgi:DNA-binding transcriptional LysR family regulator